MTWLVDILEEFTDVMSPELPKILSPRRAVDHKIVLEPGTKPPTKAPYRMAPLEAELRKQLVRSYSMLGISNPSTPLAVLQCSFRGSRMVCFGCV